MLFENEFWNQRQFEKKGEINERYIRHCQIFDRLPQQKRTGITCLWGKKGGINRMEKDGQAYK